MKDIKEILNNHEVTPSADCWQQLSQRLDQVMPQTGAESAAGSQAASEAGRNVARLAGAAKAKLIVAVAGLTIGAGVIALTAVSLLKSSPDPDPSTATPVTAPVSDTTAIEITQETPYNPNLSKTSDVAVPQPKNQTEYQPNKSSQSRAATEEVISQPVVTNPTPQIVTLNPKPLTPATPVAVTVPTTLPTPTQHITSAEEDPAVQEHADTYETPVTPQRMEIPNVFTPNGDGINDQFVIVGLEQCNKRILTVRDRTGRVIYHSDNYENEWDGGSWPDGTYFYQFTFGRQQVEETLKGSVTIIRK
ncbi:MAG: gliding motility-associated C-terminal domain-containing protein [Bacteroidales bacterium]|nr:gliding motility-associated C-terminal domain-containing protein [Bacteroidales bacterium]